MEGFGGEVGSTSQYTNPYMQGNHGKSIFSTTQESLEDVLQRLEDCSSPTTLLAACFESKTRSLLLNCASEWSPTYCSRFLETLFCLVLDGRESDMYSQGLLLMNQVMETWNDELLYSSAILHEIESSGTVKTTLFDHLCNKLLESSELNDWLRLSTLVPLVTVFRSLSRINKLLRCSPDAKPWWMNQITEWSNIIQFSYLCVCSEMSEWSENGYRAEYMLPIEDIMYAATSLLVQLLEYNESGWWNALDDSRANLICEKLLSEAMRLDDPSMPHSSYTRLSLSSLHLMILMEQRGLAQQEVAARLLNFIQGSDIVDHLILATWGSDGTLSGPRWTQRGANFCLAQWTFPILQCLYRTSNPALMQFTSASSTRRYLDNCWKALFDKIATSLQLYHLSEMVRDFPRFALDSLHATLPDNTYDASSSSLDTSVPLIWNNTLYLLKQKRLIEAGGLFLTLLNAVQFYTLSQAMDRPVVVQQLLELNRALSNNSTIIVGQPLLEQIILDVLYELLHQNRELCKYAVASLSSEGLERLILTMIPTNRSFGIQGMDVELETDESTPPAHNLSRIGDRSILIEETRTSRGFDAAKKLAAASVLASILVHRGDDIDSDHRVRYKRMDEALHEFMAGTSFSLCDAVNTLEYLKRTVRLMALVATSCEFEQLVSRLIFATASAEQENVRNLQQALKESSDLVDHLKGKEEQIRCQNEQLKRQLRAQNVQYQRNKAIIERFAAQTSKDLVDTHMRERAEAERCAEELRRRLHEMERRALTGEQEVKKFRDETLQLRAHVEEASKKANDLEIRNHFLEEKIGDSESKVSLLSNELKNLERRNADNQENDKRLHSHVKELSLHIESLEEKNASMHESLESIFADMVSLTRLYEMKEKELRDFENEKNRETNELQEIIDVERSRVADAKEKSRQLQYDNEVLSKKYAKLREKLDKERQLHQMEEEKRRTKSGSASYIDQLHLSSRSEKENRSHCSHSSYRTKSYR